MVGFYRIIPVNENTLTVYAHCKHHFYLKGRCNGGLLGILRYHYKSKEIWTHNRIIDLLGLTNYVISYLKLENHQCVGLMYLSNKQVASISTALEGI